MIPYYISQSINDTLGDIKLMVYTIEELTGKLRTARKKRGLSQRAFTTSIGIPQSRLIDHEKPKELMLSPPIMNAE
jgi:hypothetical protein